MEHGTLGEIILFAGYFAPRDWAFCHGQIMSISQNQSLFAILGTMYGGDGRSTFGLPDLRGRAPIGAGHGPGLQHALEGQRKGRDKVYFSTPKGKAVKPVNDKKKVAVSTITPSSVGRSPYQGINYIICIHGLFPSRS